MRIVLGCLALGAAVAGCAGDPVPIELNFPSVETVLQSDYARVAVFDLDGGSLGDCPTLVAQAVAGTEERRPAFDSGGVEVCDALGGGIVFEEIGDGPKAFVATTSKSNAVVLAGCTVAEVYGGAPDVVVHLAVTSRYYDVVGTPSACTSVADKCERGCR